MNTLQLGLYSFDLCPGCGETQWNSLAIPGDQSMISDGRIHQRPLEKMVCGVCGLVRHRELPDEVQIARLFEANYGLYAHTPGGTFEQARQRDYAAWIYSIAPEPAPRQIFDVGCGNGSLLLELRRHFPRSKLSGIDPAEAAVANGRRSGLSLHLGFVDEINPSEVSAELVIAINVLEHTLRPDRFLLTITRLLAPGGALLVVCPDADEPWSELLIYDHLWSFTQKALLFLARSIGLEVIGYEKAPIGVGKFHAILLRPQDTTGAGLASARQERDDKRLQQTRTYLEAWATLDEALLSRISKGGELTAFGVGEAAQLLRAYAPRVWSLVTQCTADGETPQTFDGRRVCPYKSFKPEPRGQILLAVRPQVQEILAHRLDSDGHTVVRWDDLLIA